MADKGSGYKKEISEAKLMPDFIEIIENNFSQEFCQKLVDYFDLLKSHNIAKSAQNDSSLSRLERADKSVILPNDALKTFDQDLFPGEFLGQYISSINIHVGEYLKKYPRSATGGAYCPNVKIHQVEESEGYHEWHCETSDRSSMDRCLVFITYLEQPEAGGETEFLYQKTRIEPKVGRTIIWPCSFTHLHRGNVVLKGRKTYITGWYHYK